MVDMIPVLVIDDQLVQREGVTKMVEATGRMRVVGSVSSSQEALEIIQREPIDLALIDLVLHHEHGTDIGRTLRNLHPGLKVIIYTHEKSMVLACEIFRDQSELSRPSLQGYLLTRNISSSDYLLQIYRHILDVGYFIDPDVIRWHYRFTQLEKLTPREEECALLITKCLSNTQIAEQMVISRRRVENLINSLYQKFNILGDRGEPARRVILVDSNRLLNSSRITVPEVSILIIEDQQEQRVRLSNVLNEDPRFTVLTAVGSGAAGIQAAFCTKPDVILVDIHLPDTDGFQVTRQILEGLPKTKAILMSSEDSYLFREMSIEAGAIGFLPKKLLSPEGIFKACEFSEE